MIMSYKSKIFSTALALLSAFVLASCSSDSSSTSSVEINGNCAISKVTLGSLLRKMHTTASDGSDSTYWGTISGSAYPMTVDQMSMEIYNMDSLPQGTDVTRILISSITADGTVLFQTDSNRDTVFSSSDSIDFTNPRYFTCYSTDGNQSRKYRVTVNVHNSNAEDFVWRTLVESDNMFENISRQKMFMINDKPTIVAISGGSPTLLTLGGEEGAYAWTSEAMSGLTNIDPAEVFLFKDNLCYIHDGSLYTSADGRVWTGQTMTCPASQLVAATDSMLFAYASEGIYYTVDLSEWTLDTAIDDISLFPTENVTDTQGAMLFNGNFYYVIVCGKNQAGENVIWRKTIDLQGANTEPWAIFPQADENSRAYPDKEQPVVMTYNDNLYHMGIDAEGRVNEIIISTDGGRTWIAQDEDNNPPLEESVNSVSVCVDDGDFIWIATAPTGKLVRGRLNSLSYEKTPQVFISSN